MPDIDAFVIYHPSDKHLLRELQSALQELPAVIWGPEDLLPGDPWDEFIPRNLADARIVLIICTPDTLWAGDRYLQEQLGDARDFLRRGVKKVLPVFFGDPSLCEIPYGFKDITGLDMGPGRERGIAGLRKILGST